MSINVEKVVCLTSPISEMDHQLMTDEEQVLPFEIYPPLPRAVNAKTNVNMNEGN